MPFFPSHLNEFEKQQSDCVTTVKAFHSALYQNFTMYSSTFSLGERMNLHIFTPPSFNLRFL